MSLFTYMGWSCRLRFVGSAKLRDSLLRDFKDGVVDSGAARLKGYSWRRIRSRFSVNIFKRER